MTRIQLCEPELMNEVERRLYDRIPINLIRALLRTDFTSEYEELAVALYRGKLSTKRRELVVLRVAALSNSQYERMHHLPAARLAGWSEADIAAIETGKGIERLGLAEVALLRFVGECVKEYRVSEETFGVIQGHFSEMEIAEAVLLTGFYLMTAMFLGAIAVDLDEAPAKVEEVLK
jgi:alkylhydroperoxidase family enzyme